jgi:hypothetical protein
MVVGASDTTVDGMHARTRSRECDALLFVVPRAGLKVIVHQRVNVRVLELIHEETGSRIELEGTASGYACQLLDQYLTRKQSQLTFDTSGLTAQCRHLRKSLGAMAADVTEPEQRH